jgi:hypothetical protein
VFLAARTVPHGLRMPWVLVSDVITKGFTCFLTADQGRSISFGSVIMGGAFRSFAMARSRRSWLATVLVMPVSRMDNGAFAPTRRDMPVRAEVCAGGVG